VDVALIALYLLLGGTLGFLAGLLGIGGGMAMVPLLTIVFTNQGMAPEHVIHLALGTATATILFTGVASTREHHRHGAVVWRVVAGMAPGIVLGALAGSQLVGIMSTAFLAAFFGTFIAIAATQVLIDRKPKPTRQLPGAAGLFAVGSGIGLIASMVGAGGAFLSVPFMAACNVNLRKCVATSAALGLPVAVAATIGFIVAGMRQQGLPAYSLGFVYLPALLAIVASSVVAAPLGARAAHRWPVARLRKAFAIFLYALAAYMLWKARHTA
jgi:uncharacterized membrane protein YfcA